MYFFHKNYGKNIIKMKSSYTHENQTTLVNAHRFEVCLNNFIFIIFTITFLRMLNKIK